MHALVKNRMLKKEDARRRVARGAVKPRATVRDVLGRDPQARVLAGHRGLVRLPDYMPDNVID